MGRRDAAKLRLDGAGERSAGIAEQLRLQQGFGNGSAVDYHERLGRTWTEGMQSLGYEFFARSRGAGDEDCGGARSHQAHHAI